MDLTATANSLTYNKYTPTFGYALTGFSILLHLYVLKVFSYGFSPIVKLKLRQKDSDGWLRWI
jgi:hypothetical protein